MADTTAVDMAVEVVADTTVVAAEAIAAAAGVAEDPTTTTIGAIPTIGATGTRTAAAAAETTPATWQRMRP